MLLNISSYITSAGLQAVTSSGPVGPYFAIKYFVPFYDYRLDTTICRGENSVTSALSISSLNYVSATSQNLFGEKIFANTNYNLSNNNFLYWKSSMGSLPDGTNTNVLSPQSVTTPINLDANGLPLSIVVSGSNFTSPIPGLFNISGTHQYTAGQVSTLNPLSAASWPLSAFYRVDSYSPNANGLTSATGTFKCRIPPSNSSFKFNGLALYAVKVNSNGIDDYGNGTSFAFNPVLFSVVLLNQAQFKQAQTGGLNDFEISVDLGFDWNTVSPGVSGNPVYINNNYWTKLPTSTTTSAYGLNYTGDVVISSSAVGGSWFPAAKLTVTEPGNKQLRLGYDLTKFTDIQTIRFPVAIGGVFPNSTDMAVLSIDTSCPQDSLLQLGYQTSALGIKSLAIGCYASATGYSAYSGNTTSAEVDIGGEGGYTVAIGVKPLAQGFGSWAIGYSTSAIGYLNFAGGDSSLATYNPLWANDPGSNIVPINGLNFAYGKGVTAISRAATDSFDYPIIGATVAEDSDGSNVAFGYKTYSGGGVSFAHGVLTSALGFGSLALGQQTLANGVYSIVGGYKSIANSDVCFALGTSAYSYSPFSFSYGINSVAGLLGNTNIACALAFGQNVSASNLHTIALGTNSQATGYNSFAYGQNYNNSSNQYTPLTIAQGTNSIAFGNSTTASGEHAYAFGHGSWAAGQDSYTFGTNVSAAGNYSLALGNFTWAGGLNSTSLGQFTSAIGNGSFAGGFYSIALGNYSTSFGYLTTATGNFSLALGQNSNSVYDNSIAIGNGATATKANQIVIGGCDNDSVLIQGKNIQIGGNCAGATVTIPGISQFNDSIRVSVNFYTGSDPATQANSVVQTPTYSARTFSIDIRRSGYRRRVYFTETGSNTNIFNFSSITGDSSGGDILVAIPLVAGVSWSYYPLSNRTNVQLNCTKLLGGVNLYNETTWNLTVCLDKDTNNIVLFVGGATGFSGPINYTYNFLPTLNNILYQSQFGNNNGVGVDSHSFGWIENVNMIDSYINYDKANVNVITNIICAPYNGDGYCAFNLLNSTIGNYKEGSTITLYYQNNYNDYSTTALGGSERPSYTYTVSSPYQNVKVGTGQQVAKSMGSFVNSNGYTIIPSIILA